MFSRNVYQFIFLPVTAGRACFHYSPLKVLSLWTLFILSQVKSWRWYLVNVLMYILLIVFQVEVFFYYFLNSYLCFLKIILCPLFSLILSNLFLLFQKVYLCMKDINSMPVAMLLKIFCWSTCNSLSVFYYVEKCLIFLYIQVYQHFYDFFPFIVNPLWTASGSKIYQVFPVI